MRVIVAAVAALAVLLAGAGTATGQCRLIAINDPAADVAAQPIEVRVGALDERWSTPFRPSFANRVMGVTVRPRPQPRKITEEGRLQRLESAFAEALIAVLGGPARSAAASRSSEPLVLQADITGLDPGNRVRRALFASGRALAAIRAVLARRDGRPVAAITCDRSTAGGLLGEGGLFALWESGDALLRDNLRKIAQSIAREIGRAGPVGAELMAKRRVGVGPGELRYQNRVWLERPSDRWSLKDATSVFTNFMTLTYRRRPIGGPPVLMRGVHALWLTRPAIQGLRRSQALLEDGEESVWVHPFSLVMGEGTLRAIEEEDAYAIAVWPWDKMPVYWNPVEIVASTFVRRGDRDERIPPTGFVGPPWPPAIFLFPRTGPDGRPLIASLNQVLELCTRLNGQTVQSRFDLVRFGLADVSGLEP